MSYVNSYLTEEEELTEDTRYIYSKCYTCGRTGYEDKLDGIFRCNTCQEYLE